MLEVILFICPAFLAMLIHGVFHKEEKKAIEHLYLFGSYCLIINLLVIIVLSLYSSVEFYIYESVDRLAFTFKYLISAVVFAIILPIAAEIIRKNVNFEIKFRKLTNEKKNKK